MQSGEIKFSFVEGNLICPEDFSIMQNVVANSSFTLDSLDNTALCHPVLEMKYSPESIKNTNYLATLLSADYLLKMIITKYEINSKSPFELREIAFLNRLPAQLQKLLKYDSERDTIHRFWIESGDTGYVVEQEGHLCSFYFFPPKITLRQQKMKIVDGKLADDKEMDNTPEAEFVQKFTENYDEIGSYFPELLRLRVLAIIQAFGKLIRERLHKFKATDDVVNQVIQFCNVFLSQINNVNNSELRTQFRNQFTPNILKAFQVHDFNFAACFEVMFDYFKGSNSYYTTKLKLLQSFRLYSKPLHNAFKAMKFNLEINKAIGAEYIPAVYGGIRVYGGVRLCSMPVQIQKTGGNAGDGSGSGSSGTGVGNKVGQTLLLESPRTMYNRYGPNLGTNDMSRNHFTGPEITNPSTGNHKSFNRKSREVVDNVWCRQWGKSNDSQYQAKCRGAHVNKMGEKIQHSA